MLLVETYRVLEQDEKVAPGDQWCLSWMLDTDPDGCWCPVDLFIGKRVHELKDKDVIVRRALVKEIHQ